MSKIKEIRDRFAKDPKEYSILKFLIARRMFTFVVALYFMTVLFTIGGFYLPGLSIVTLSAAAYHLYSLVVIATIWFGFSWAEYIVAIYIPTQVWIKYAVLIFLTVFGGAGLYIHLFRPSFLWL
jgi:hypothetical protein